MKKILSLFSVLLMTSAFAQCNINGNSEIRVGTTSTYSVQNDIAQCRDCHLWENNGGVASLQGNVKRNSVRLTGNSVGKMTLNFAMLSPQGIVQCSKNIEVVDSSGRRSDFSSTNSSTNCNSDFTDYAEKKNTDGMVTFVPSTNRTDYKYEWTATYSNGDSKTSTSSTPNFSYSKENGISSVTVRITSPNCISNFSKTYNATYWTTF